MKRKIGILFMCVVLAMSLVLFTACKSVVVDVSGNYETTDYETVSKKLENKTASFVEEGVFKAYELMKVETKEGENKTDAKVELNATMEIAELKAVGDIVVTSTENGKEVEDSLGNISTEFAMDGTNLYITLDGEKVYMPIGSSDAGDIASALDYLKELVGDINIESDSNAKYFVYEKGDTLKVKMQSESSMTYGELTQYSNVEMVMVFEGDALSGVAINVELKFTGGENYTIITIEIQLGRTNDKVVLPDLSFYKPYQG